MATRPAVLPWYQAIKATKAAKAALPPWNWQDVYPSIMRYLAANIMTPVELDKNVNILNGKSGQGTSGVTLNLSFYGGHDCKVLDAAPVFFTLGYKPPSNIISQRAGTMSGFLVIIPYSTWAGVYYIMDPEWDYAGGTTPVTLEFLSSKSNPGITKVLVLALGPGISDQNIPGSSAKLSTLYGSSSSGTALAHTLGITPDGDNNQVCVQLAPGVHMQLRYNA